MSVARAIEIAQDLVRINSVSRFSNALASEYVAHCLHKLDFQVETVAYEDEYGVKKYNLIARRGPNAGGIMYSAHTDVVPADDWHPAPEDAFLPKIVEGRLYGRGACDMKGSLATALAAVEQIDALRQSKPIYFCVSADEELGMMGARQIAEKSIFFREMVDNGTVAIVGEPTELQVFYAHKGTLLLTLQSHGKSAHTSSRDGINANAKLFEALPSLEAVRQRTETDQGLMNDLFDPPTLSWNWIVRNEPYASNITPSLAELKIFIRPMPDVNHHHIVDEVQQIAQRFGLIFKKSEEAGCLNGSLKSTLVQDMLEITRQVQAKTACYATDGSVLQSISQIVVCGPGSIAQAHRNDEWISLDQLERGTEVYRQAFMKYAC